MVTTKVLEKRIDKLATRITKAKKDSENSLPPEKLRKIHKKLKRSQRKLKNFTIAAEKANPAPKEKAAE